MPKFAWSYSSLSAFETCPKQFYHKRVAKDVVEPESEHLRWGNEVHKAFEDYLKGVERGYPDWFEQWKPICNAILNHQKRVDSCVIEAEKEAAITEDFKPCGWWDDNVWCRGKFDLVVVTGERAHIFDWKTGKRRFNEDQLKLFAALAFIYYPDVQTVAATFKWLKTDEQDTKVYRRDEAHLIWQDFLPRVERMKQAYITNNWPAHPSGLCRKWCPVPQSKCPHSGRVE